MIRKCQILFCDNEHGTGDVMFPDLALAPHDIAQIIIEGSTARGLRAAAKKAGWGRVNGNDYCPNCMESGI